MLGSATTSLAFGSSILSDSDDDDAGERNDLASRWQQYSQRRHFVIVLKRMTRETLPLLLRYARKGVSDLRRSHGRLLPGCRACLVAAEIAERCILPNAPWRGRFLPSCACRQPLARPAAGQALSRGAV